MTGNAIHKAVACAIHYSVGHFPLNYQHPTINGQVEASLLTFATVSESINSDWTVVIGYCCYDLVLAFSASI